MLPRSLVHLGFVCAMVVGAAAQQHAIVDPHAYRSPGGEFVFEVDPSRRDGAGPCRARFTREGAVVWERELAFTPWCADVDDEGVVAAAGHDGGLSDAREEARAFVAISRANGAELAIIGAEPRRALRPGAPRWPVVRGVLVAAEQDLVVVRRSSSTDAFGEEWWCFARAARAFTRLVRPTAPPGFGRLDLVVVRPVYGAPLLVASALCAPRSVAYGVFDLEGKLVLELEHERATTPEKEAFDPLLELRRGVTVRSPAWSRTFQILTTRERRVWRSYTLGRSEAGAWWADAMEDESEDGFEWRRPLFTPHHRIPEVRWAAKSVLGSLPAAGDAVRFRAVLGVAFDAEGNVECLVQPSRDPDEYARLVFSPNGELVRSEKVEPTLIASSSPPRACRLKDGTWVVAQSPVASDHLYRFRCFDAGFSGTYEALDAPNARGDPVRVPHDVLALSALPDGGFVSLVEPRWPLAAPRRLLVSSSTGHVRWKKTCSLDADPADLGVLLAPEDVTVLTDGRIVLVDAVRAALQVFDAGGAFVRGFPLADAFGGRPRFANRVVADGSDGVVVHDGAGSMSRLVRCSLDGTVRERIDPMPIGGIGIARRTEDLAVAPDGTLWWNAGSHVSTLDADGAEHVRIRSAPIAPDPPEAWDAAVDGFGNVFVLEADGVRAYASNGEERGRIALPGESQTLQIEGRAEGGFFAAERRGVWSAFDVDGKPLGAVSPSRPASLPPPVSDRRGGTWSTPTDAPDLVRYDLAGKELARIARRSDGAWLRPRAELAVGPDGSFCVYDRGDVGCTELELGAPGLGDVLDVYAPDGKRIESKGMWWSELNGCAFTGRCVAVVYDRTTLDVIDTRENATIRYGMSRPGGVESRWRVFAGPAPGEVWALELASRTLHRLEVPK